MSNQSGMSQEELLFLNKYLVGSKSAQEKKTKELNKMLGRLEKCSVEVAKLERLPGTEQARISLGERIEATKKQAHNGQFKEAHKALEGIKKDLRKAVAQASKTELGKGKLERQESTLVQIPPFPQGGSKSLGKEVWRNILEGKGPLFGKVLSAMETVEKDPSPQNLQKLKEHAEAYLDKQDGEDQQHDQIRIRKIQACKDILLDIELQQTFGEECKNLKSPPWNSKEEAKVKQLQVTMSLKKHPAKPLTTKEGKGASDSFFIDDKNGEKAFIFKPSDGENIAGYGWEKGGGAGREVMVGALNEQLREMAGLDCGVSPTSLVKLTHDSLGSESNQTGSERSGALQTFVKSNGKKLNDVVDTLPVEEVQKVMLLDMVTLQLDRNGDNFLCQDGEDGQPRLIPIDAGNAVPSRKAFEAFRRNFQSGALFHIEQSKEPFSEKMLSHIEAMDPDKLAEGMKKTRQDMSEIDQEVGDKITDENVEMVRRSVMFLKAAAPKFTPKQLGDAYSYVFQKVLDAPPNGIEKAIEKAMQEQELRNKQFEELEKRNFFDVLSGRGWPVEQPKFLNDDPGYLLRLLDSGKENPAALLEEQKKIDKLGGKEAALKLEPNLEQMPVTVRLQRLTRHTSAQENTEIANDPLLREAAQKHGVSLEPKEPNTTLTDLTIKQRLEPVKTYEDEGGDEALTEVGVKTEGMSMKDKLEALWRVLYLKEGGDAKLQTLENAGIKVAQLKDKGNLEGVVSEFRAWDEYVKLGGDDLYVKLGGAQGDKEGAKKKLAALKFLLSLEGMKEEAVREQIEEGEKYIREQEAEVKKQFQAAAILCEKIRELTKMLAPQGGVKMDMPPPRIKGAIDKLASELAQLDLAARRSLPVMERELGQLLPTSETATQYGLQRDRDAVGNILLAIQGDVDREFFKFDRWAKEASALAVAAVMGNLNQEDVYEKILRFNYSKLKGDWTLVGRADSRVSMNVELIGQLLDKVGKAEQPDPQDLGVIRSKFAQLDLALPNLKEVYVQFHKEYERLNAKYPDFVNPGNQKFTQLLLDFESFPPLMEETSKNIEKFTVKIEKLLKAFSEFDGKSSKTNEPTPSTGNGDNLSESGKELNLEKGGEQQETSNLPKRSTQEWQELVTSNDTNLLQQAMKEEGVPGNVAIAYCNLLDLVQKTPTKERVLRLVEMAKKIGMIVAPLGPQLMKIHLGPLVEQLRTVNTK